MAWASPRNANGAISVPVLTPVTASNSGLASGCWAGSCCHPWRNPAPKAPQSPPPEMIRMLITGGACCPPAVCRSYSALVRSSNWPSILRPVAVACSSLVVRSVKSPCCVSGGRVMAGLQPPNTSPASTVTATYRRLRRAAAAARARAVRRIATVRGLMDYLREKSSHATSVSVGLAKLPVPSADGFIGHDHSTDEQEFFHLIVAERKAEIQPDGVADNLTGKP